MCIIWSVLFNEIVIVCVSLSVAGKRRVETVNPIACATVNCKEWRVCKSAVVLYCLCVSVIKMEGIPNC
jgi:hypothetical protein